MDAPQKNALSPPPEEVTARRLARAHHETSGTYSNVVTRLCPRHRVIECKDAVQWILQKRDAERSGQPRWTGIGYFRTRQALIRVSRATCARIDPNAMAILLALPAQFGGSA